MKQNSLFEILFWLVTKLNSKARPCEWGWATISIVYPRPVRSR